MNDTEKYKGYTIRIEHDDSPENPVDWGSFTVHMASDLGVVGGDADQFIDEYNNLTIGARAMLKSGRMWPIRYSSHGPMSNYSLAYDASDCDGFIEFTPEYVKGVSRDERKRYAESDLEVYTDWANGSVYGYTIINRYGEELDSLWGMYGYEDVIEEAKRAVDYDIEHDKPAHHAKHAGELHR